MTVRFRRNRVVLIFIFMIWILAAPPYSRAEVLTPANKASIILAENHEPGDDAEEFFTPPKIIPPLPAATNPTENNIPAPSTPYTSSAPAVANRPNQAAISSHFPWVWVMTRALGISSYFLLFLMVSVGMMITTGIIFRFVSPSFAWTFHRTIGLLLFTSVILHLLTLYLDKFIVFKLSEIFIPFLSKYHPLLVALGIAGLYILLLLLITSLFQINRWPKFWRSVHFLGYPMFIAVFLHGILIGTDRQVVWLQTFYWITAAIVLMLTTYRLIWKYQPQIKSI